MQARNAGGFAAGTGGGGGDCSGESNDDDSKDKIQRMSKGALVSALRDTMFPAVNIVAGRE